MTQAFRLYRKNRSEIDDQKVVSFADLGYSVMVFRPKLFKTGIDRSERIKKILWYLITRGHYQILYVMDGKKVIHYSFILPANFRFPFMELNDLEIGPCFTDIDYRGQGIYSRVLQMIPQMFKESVNTFWIYTLQSNLTSQRAIERSGYSYCGSMRSSKIFKILKLAEK